MNQKRYVSHYFVNVAATSKYKTTSKGESLVFRKKKSQNLYKKNFEKVTPSQPISRQTPP